MMKASATFCPRPGDRAIVNGNLISSVTEPSTAVASEFMLEQNYPNSFNRTTVVSYSVPGQLPAPNHVRLVVYDLLGREVAVLVNERKAPGSYSLDFNAGGLASGVYFCRVIAGDFVKVTKMVLAR